MKYNQNRQLMRACYAAAAGLILLTGFTSLAAEQHTAETEAVQVQEEGRTETTADGAAWDFAEIAAGIHEDTVVGIKAAAEKAHEDYTEKVEEERRKAEEAEKEAQRKAEEEAAREAAAQAAAQTAAEEKELLAALIFCEAGNQPYEGQVAVGAVVMNRVNSGQFPDTITDVIYQSGQFTPAMTGWLDSVLASDGYTDSAMQAAADALAGSNPIGDCLYFSTGGNGYQLGDHFFR